MTLWLWALLSFKEAIMDKEQFWEELRSGKFVSMVKESSKGKSLKSSLEAFNILKPLFADEDDVEKMFFVFMDQKNRIISIENLFKGSIAGSAIYPREIIKRIIGTKANGIVLSHNLCRSQHKLCYVEKNFMWSVIIIDDIDRDKNLQIWESQKTLALPRV
jgi:hypothetical protein